MNGLCVRLFSRFSIQSNGHMLDLEAAKAREFFCYLLLYRECPHPRERLADLLWPDVSLSQSRRYLRKALWQLQSTLEEAEQMADAPILLVEHDWIRVNPDADLRLDIAIFERAFACTQGVPGRQLDARHAQQLQDAVALYRGDLLEGWYQDWCIYERERFQYSYLAMLDKLMDYCEAQRDYEAGLSYGMRILRYDRARERTHRKLIRLHCLAGDRTSALRQYERCRDALQEELNVGPSKNTRALYERICADQLPASHLASLEFPQIPDTPSLALCTLVEYLRNTHTMLSDLQRHLHYNIQNLEASLSDHG